MATMAKPVEEPRRPNIATADVQLPAVRDYEQVDREIIRTLHPTVAWFIGLGVAIFFLLLGIGAWMYQIQQGLGVAGYNPPVMWGVYIITFVFWVGIGHAGTLISAILYLFRAGFRTTIYRCAEAMTVFAVMTAALFPILHLGRPWKFFWLIPYPNWRYLWPQFKSPLVWDVFAILTYFTISSTFLYVGLIPDIAVLRDRETNPVRKRIFSILSLGWRNSDREWRHFARAYLFLAAFSTPLVLSVHSVVSFDFAMALTPGWHTTIFPPYFVARRGVRLHDRVVRGVVLGHGVREELLREPDLGSVVVGVGDPVHVQHGAAAHALQTELAPEHYVAVHPVAVHQPRHVVRALRDRRSIALA
jgi:molybdopterin-containing oxidoreductase family membrane subunit